MNLVSLEQLKLHLKVDTDDGDADLSFKLAAASRAVMNYISGGRRTQAFTDSAGDVFEDSNGTALFVPEDVQHATLFLVGFWDRNRAGDDEKQFDPDFLPAPVKSILVPYRDPSLA